jgi:hypothetical protein
MMKEHIGVLLVPFFLTFTSSLFSYSFVTPVSPSNDLTSIPTSLSPLLFSILNGCSHTCLAPFPHPRPHHLLTLHLAQNTPYPTTTSTSLAHGSSSLREPLFLSFPIPSPCLPGLLCHLYHVISLVQRFVRRHSQECCWIHSTLRRWQILVIAN